MNKALLPLLLCCFIFPASGKDAGWQWYNEKITPKEKENKPVPAAPRQEPDIMQKLAALQTATKRALYEAILYPGVDNFVKYFRLQNYWTQQAGLFTMSAKKAMLAHPELDYNLQYSHYNGTVLNQLAADQAQQRQAIAKLAEHYGIMFFYRGQDPIDGQLAQVINGFRDTYGLSVIPVSVDGVINPLLPDSRLSIMLLVSGCGLSDPMYKNESSTTQGNTSTPVSYTHLDVYKRQHQDCAHRRYHHTP